MTVRADHILIERNKIQERVKDLAKMIIDTYGDDLPLLLAVLTGSFVFAADLIRLLPPTVKICFIKACSYGSGSVSSGDIKITGLEDVNIAGKNVLIIEDIIDTGLTLERLILELKQKKPKDVKVCVLLDKPSRRKTQVKPDFVGFEVPNVFIVGYGLDFAEHYRGSPDIYEVSENNEK